MRYKNSRYRRPKNTFPLEVSCAHCKTPVVIYAKEGKGNLLKLQFSRIIESEMNLEKHAGSLVCFNCEEELAKKGTYKGRIAYWTIRGKINTRRMQSKT